MSNNKLGRKALALGALTGLGLSFLAAAPAPAVAAVGGSVSLLPANGTGYGTLENVNRYSNHASDIFTLKTTISSDVADFADGELKYQIKSDGSSYADFYVGYGYGDHYNHREGMFWDDNYTYNDQWYGTYSSVANAQANSWSGFEGTTNFYDVDSDGVVVSPNAIAASDQSHFGNDYGMYESNARHTVNYLSIGTHTTNHNVNAIITAFIDTNNNNTLDADEEVVSTTRTVNFYKPSAITQTTTWDQPKAGDNALVVHTAYSPELNVKQINDNENYTEDNQLYVDFGWRGAEATTWNYIGSDNVDGSDNNSSSIDFGYYSIGLGYSYTAKPAIDTYDGDNVYGAEVNTGTRVDQIDRVTLKGVYSADENTIFNTIDPYTIVRAGKTANIDAATYYGGKRAGAGIPVTVTLRDTDLEADSAVSAGGKTLTAGGDDVSYETVTDANGHVAIAVTGGVAGDDIQVIVEYGNGYYSDNLDVSWQKASVADFYSQKVGSCDDDEAPYGIIEVSQAITRGTSVTVDYQLFDQFGQLYAGTDYRVRVVSNGEDATVDSAKFVGGKASVTFTDASTAVNPDYAVIGYLEKVNTETQNYVDQSWYEGQHIFTYVGGPVAGSIEANQTTHSPWYDQTDSGVKSQLVSYNDFPVGDFRGVYNDNPAYIKSTFTEGQYAGSLGNTAYGDKQWIIVSGRVRDANNVPISGAKVTLSGKGLLIGSDSYALMDNLDWGYAYRGDYNGFEGDSGWRGAVTGLESLTVYADKTGYYEVHVASHTAGATDLTISAAGKTATTTLNYVTSIHNGDVQNIHATKAVTTGSQSVLAGTTTPLTTTVTDKFGNVLPGVVVKYAVSGNAVISGYGWTDGQTGTDAKGQVTASIIAGSNDIGTASITVSLPLNKIEVDGLNSYLNNNWYAWFEPQADVANGYNDFSRLNWLQGAPVADTVVVNTYGVETAKVLKTSKRVVTASWSFAKGKSVLVVVDGYRRYHQTELSNAENSFSKKLAKGKHTISIYINGLLLDRLVTKIK